MIAAALRVSLAAGGGALALRLAGDLDGVFFALASALAAFGVVNVIAIARGAWFSKEAWLVMRQPPQPVIPTEGIECA